VEKIKTHAQFSTSFFPPLTSCRLLDNVEKYGTARKAKYNTEHALCMLGNYGYNHTLRICNTYGFSTVNNGYANAPQMLYAHCLSCLKPGFC